MVWAATQFERHLDARLGAELGQSGRDLFSGFETARIKLVDGIYREIAGAEPQLSDHSADHIAHVQRNATALLSDKHTDHGLSAIDLYCLGMLILFHDVGKLVRLGNSWVILAVGGRLVAGTSG